MTEKAKRAAKGHAPFKTTSATATAPTKIAKPKIGLLVSVRNPEEAEVAVEAGADLIDVKDPSKGSLGIAHHEAVAAVLEVVNGRVPVSAALGEWSENVLTAAHWHLELPLNYVKWGLAGYKGGPAWGEDLLVTKRQVPLPMEVVAVAYADWEKANSVPPSEVVKFAKRFRYKAFLFDTFNKDGRTLLDHMSVDEIRELVDSLKRSGVAVALGGSLKPEDIKKLKDIHPDWYAVRGSVCAGGKRDGVLDAVRIKKWKELLG